MELFYYNVQRVIYKLCQFLSFDRFHYILCPKIHHVKLWQIILMGNFVANGAILAWVTWFQHSVFATLGCSTLYKIIALIFKFINVDDFK